jgi:opacity protein-like surface antigen
MKVNISLVILGAVAASAIALPAQAAVLTTTPGGSIAYGITDLNVSGTPYNVSFKLGTFNDVYSGVANPFAGSFAEPLGAAIITALGGKQLTSNVTGFNTGIYETFFIPKSATGTNPDQDLFLECFTTGSNGCPARDRSDNQRGSDRVLYATYQVSSTTPTGNNIPTPALIPGLLGMGLAAMRKKQQAA